MSYNVRDDNGLFGPLAGVEMPNGAGASTVVAHQLFEGIGFNAVAATGFAASTTYTIFLVPPAPSTATGLAPLGGQYKIMGASHYYSTAATAAANYSIEVCPAGTANGAGRDAVLNQALNVAATTTPTPLTLSTNVNNLLVNPGDRINLIVGATATTGLVDFCLTIFLARVS